MLKNLKNGSIITPETRVAVMVSAADIREGKSGQYIVGSVRDKTMSLDYKVWNATGMTSTVSMGNVIEITSGRVTEWQGTLQLIIDGAALVPLSCVKDLDVIPTSAYTKEELLDSWAILVREAIAPYNKRMETLLAVVQQSKIWEKFMYMPAAKGMHHAYTHGLLEHAVNTAYMSEQMAGYVVRGGEVNVPVMVTAALLHDLGKVLEYDTNALHMITEFGMNGVLMGHLFLGTAVIRNMVRGMEDGPSAEELDLLSHIILAHHGWKSEGYGTVTDPATIEAFIVSQADNLEAKINAISVALLDKEAKVMVPVSATGGKKFCNYCAKV
jgi:3'-5' exoribonuclease